MLIAFGTDEGTYLNDDHVGMAKYFYVYEILADREELVEQRENVKFKGDESLKHGGPEKARATSLVLHNVDVLVGNKFGPNITRLLKKYVCVVVKTDTLTRAREMVRGHMERMEDEKNKGEQRKQIVLRT